MSSFAALLLATPMFGLSLQPPSIEPIVSPVAFGIVAGIHAPLLLQDEESGEGEGDNAQADEGSNGSAQGLPSLYKTQEGKKAEQDKYREDVKRRNSLAKIHKPLGIATWVAMTITEVFGFIQYYNRYGFFADEGSNPCVKGTAVFGQGQCTNPIIHATAATVTTALYAATFTVSLMMPDPDDLSNSKGEFADTVRMHKLLRWVHFGGMVAQILLGIVIANGGWVGLNRANDYKTLQTLATVHLATGLVTLGALTWAGALMTF
jgi:hypothetical protein